MPDYYVRQPSEETARGPYTLEKLASLADAGKVDTETLYYDEPMEAWIAIGSNDKLKGQLFPEKKKLSLRNNRAAAEDNDGEEVVTESVTVENMLAAAEGQTAETEHLKRKARWQERTASISLPLIAIALFASAASHVVPGWETVSNIFQPPKDAEDVAAYVQILRQPIIVLGFIDLLLGLFILLGSTGIFGLLRFRLMAGLGYFGVLTLSLYALGDHTALYTFACVAIAHAALFICTLTLHFATVVIASILAIGGMLGYFYFTSLGSMLGLM